MKTDSLFYRLFQRMPALLLELAGLDIPAEGYRFKAEEVKQTAFRLDGILLPPEGDAQRALGDR
jgi:predicted transposase YdaD